MIRGPRPYPAQWPHVSKGRAKERRLHQSFQPHRRVRCRPSTWRRSWPTGCGIWRFSQCGVRVDFSVGRRSRTHAFLSEQTKRRRDVSRLILHQCGLVGCRVGEASNPGPGLSGGFPEPSSHDESVSALVLPSTQRASGTLPTWADSDRPRVGEPGRNVRPRLRVSPSILDALEEDLEVARRDDKER